MKTKKINENRSKMNRKIKLRFSNLLDSDLEFKDGKQDVMLAKLQINLGKTKEELLEIIAGL